MNRPAVHSPEMAAKAGSVLFSQWSEIERLRKVVLKHGGVDAIHDLRVASRRLRATISLFTPFVDGKEAKFIVRSIRKITRTLGVVRTMDEAIIHFGPLTESLPVLSAGLATVRQREFQSVLASLEAFPQRRIDKRIRRQVAALADMSSTDGHSGSETVQQHLIAISSRRYQAVHALVASALIPGQVGMRHALRIAIKKWRYLLETLGQVSDRDYGQTLETLKAYQSALGNLNDMAEFGLLCDTLGLPLDEVDEIRTLLNNDSREYLAHFLTLAAARPLQNPVTP